MADIGLQPGFSLSESDMGTAVYADTRVHRGTIAGSTMNVVDGKQDLPYIGTPVNRGILSREMSGVFPKSVDDRNAKQLWN
jgi:hypothetical protein